MVKVYVEVREGADRLEVAVCADSIDQAVGITKERFPGREVRVVFPIHGEEFFGDGAEDSSQPGLLNDRIL